MLDDLGCVALDGVTVETADIRDLRYADRSFDCVLAEAVTSHEYVIPGVMMTRAVTVWPLVANCGRVKLEVDGPTATLTVAVPVAVLSTPFDSCTLSVSVPTKGRSPSHFAHSAASPGKQTSS